MRDVAALLRRELENLEAELAADPRAQKAQKIRELLALYANSGSIATADLVDTGLKIAPSVATAKGGKSRINWLRSLVLGRKHPQGSATIARSRLIAISQSNHWTNATPAWLQLQRDATGRPLTYDGEWSRSATSLSVIPPSSKPASSSTSVQQEASRHSRFALNRR
jgi:hypothetical protein